MGRELHGFFRYFFEELRMLKGSLVNSSDDLEKIYKYLVLENGKREV